MRSIIYVQVSLSLAVDLLLMMFEVHMAVTGRRRAMMPVWPSRSACVALKRGGHGWLPCWCGPQAGRSRVGAVLVWPSCVAVNGPHCWSTMAASR